MKAIINIRTEGLIRPKDFMSKHWIESVIDLSQYEGFDPNEPNLSWVKSAPQFDDPAWDAARIALENSGTSLTDVRLAKNLDAIDWLFGQGGNRRSLSWVESAILGSLSVAALRSGAATLAEVEAVIRRFGPHDMDPSDRARFGYEIAEFFTSTV